MARRKRARIAELSCLPNVIDREQLSEGGDWLRSYFPRPRPIILELGCGRGEYSLMLAARHPDCCVLGVDRNGGRLWKGAKRALELGLQNLVFVRSRVEKLRGKLKANQIDSIWIPFPDPLPKRRHEKHRLLAPDFLELYDLWLRKRAHLHLKTDSPELLQYALKSIRQVGGVIQNFDQDVHARPRMDGDPLALVTTYERRHLDSGKKIKYLRFRLPATKKKF